MTLTVIPTTGPAGTALLVSGAGYGRRATVTVTMADVSKTVRANRAGEWTATLTVPALPAGPAVVTARSKIVETATFTVTETPPPPPPPPSPADPTIPRGSTVLWQAGHETATMDEYRLDWGGGIYDSGVAGSVAVADHPHTGLCSARCTIDTAAGSSGTRLYRWKEAREHREAYFSAWMFMPQQLHLSGSQRWWNVFQWKTRSTDGRVDPVWAFYADEDAGGLFLKAGWGWGGTPLAGPYATSDVSGKWYQPIEKTYIPAGRWVNFTGWLRSSKDFDGAIKFWQDGQLLFDFSGIRTSFDNPAYNAWRTANEWSVNLYSDGLSPNPATLYFDDLLITA